MENFSANFQHRIPLKMAKCFLKLDTRRALKDGCYPVTVAVSYGTNLYLPTGISVNSDQWDPAGKKYVGENARVVNDVLSSVLVRISSKVLSLRESGKFSTLNNKDLRDYLTSEIEEPRVKRPTLLEVAEECKATKRAKKTVVGYRLTISKLTDFIGGERVYIDDIGHSWIAGFEKYLGGSVNANSHHLRNFRSICNFARNAGYTTHYPFQGYHIKSEETMKKALETDQLRDFIYLDGLDPYAAEHRDMFVLMFCLMGINAKDLAGLTEKNIVKDRIEYRRSKTGRLFSIKLEPEALAIIERHKGKEHLLAPFDRYADYSDWLHHMNDALKRMCTADRFGRSKPIEDEVSSNWARHTWATIAADIDIADPSITLGLGHTVAGHTTTAIYIKRKREKVDDANRKVLDYVFYGRDWREK